MLSDSPDAAENDVWTADDLEAAYQRALDALDDVESEVAAVAEQLAPAASDPPAVPASPPAGSAVSEEAGPSVTAEQVIEACLFVGGAALTAGKLASVLKGDYSANDVEQMIERLSGRYRSEGRPYEIVLGEGGYRLTLNDEYERLRHKVYGLGPKEVRLSQEALEVLALVAYQQPISEAEMTELGKPQAGPTLRQLLRRDLIAVERAPDDPKLVRYRTTPRFLSLFGVGKLDDLPRPEDLAYK